MTVAHGVDLAPVSVLRNRTTTAPPAPTEPADERQRDVARSDSVVHGRTRIVYWCLTTLGVASSALFWRVWFRSHTSAVGAWLFILLTLALAYDGTFLPSVYFYYVGQMRRPRPVTVPHGLRVALITLCVPAKQSLEVIVDQLRALSRVRYPHDSWVLDEGNVGVARREAERLGVRYFGRADVKRYNQPTAPFQAKTKAGNVNAWIDAHGND